jgi:hypothetical protein
MEKRPDVLCPVARIRTSAGQDEHIIDFLVYTYKLMYRSRPEARERLKAWI